MTGQCLVNVVFLGPYKCTILLTYE